MTREDLHTPTVDAAAYFERHRSDGYTDPMREAPSAADLADDDDLRDPGGRRRATPPLTATVTAALRLAGDAPDVRDTRPGIVAIATTLPDDRVTAILAPLGIEVARGADNRLYGRDNLRTGGDIGQPPF